LSHERGHHPASRFDGGPSPGEHQARGGERDHGSFRMQQRAMTARAVIGYDGTEEAANALEFAARTLALDSAIVANVWHDPATELVTAPLAGPPPVPSPQREAALRTAAEAVAQEGADRAAAAGLPAVPATRRSVASGDVARVLGDLAEESGCDLVVIGRRHSSMLEAALLGSVSTKAVRDERRPVLVVPS
jgi:nucleotide-binding universal stress UspA family protein